jgi:hypothetical protein
MAQSGWSLSLDVWSARFLAWAASWGRDAELTPEAHAYFYDRYSRLAAHHRVRGRLRRAARLELKEPAFEADGTTLGGVVASFEDITERKRLEEAWRQASSELAALRH